MLKWWLALLLVCTGCGSALSPAILAANADRAAVVKEGDKIDKVCVPKYHAAQTPADIVRADEKCVPAFGARDHAEDAWIALVRAIRTAERTGNQAGVADAQARAEAAKKALEDAVRGLR